MTTRQLARRIALRTGIEVHDAESVVRALRELTIENPPETDDPLATDIGRFLRRLRSDTPFRADRVAPEAVAFPGPMDERSGGERR